MTRLPAWARNAEARNLLAQIVENPPETRIQRSDWGSRTIYRAWKRPDVARLKRIYVNWWNANYDRPDRERNPEQPDELIGRLIAEAEQARRAA